MVLVIVLALPHARDDQPHAVRAARRQRASAEGRRPSCCGRSSGWEIMASLSGRYHSPGRDIARAAAAALVVVSVLYVGIAFCTVAVLGPGTRAGAAVRPARHRSRRRCPPGDDGGRRAADRGHHQHLLRREPPSWVRRWPATARCPRWLARRDGAQGRCHGARSGWWPALGARHDGGDGGARARHQQRHCCLTTATFALVYLAGTAAALLLLEGWGRLAAVVSVVASAGLVAVTGWRGAGAPRPSACSGWCGCGTRARPTRFRLTLLATVASAPPAASAGSAVGAVTPAPLGSFA